ncbi:MAG: helix-turn-helix domain-containing protein [Solirubrobacteraceae bacterium]
MTAGAPTTKLRRTDGPLRHPARPDEILAAACRAIVARGLADTRVGDIARAAGTSTGTIHYYFDSKQEGPGGGSAVGVGPVV